MSVLKCVVADDEPIARQIVENYIDALPQLEVITSCKNAFEVMEILQKEEVDLLFLDINMPRLSGLALLKTMKNTPHVIITTAYPEYALEGFELNVTDYLLKPFSLERFIQAVHKVSTRNASLQQNSSLPPEDKQQDSIFVKSDKKMIKIPFDQIYYVEAYGNYIKIFTDTMTLTPQTLSVFLEKLPASFLRIHKSIIINFNTLKMLEGNLAILNNGSKLRIGKSYKKEVLERVNANS